MDRQTAVESLRAVARGLEAGGPMDFPALMPEAAKAFRSMGLQDVADLAEDHYWNVSRTRPPVSTLLAVVAAVLDHEPGGDGLVVTKRACTIKLRELLQRTDSHVEWETQQALSILGYDDLVASIDAVHASLADSPPLEETIHSVILQAIARSEGE